MNVRPVHQTQTFGLPRGRGRGRGGTSMNPHQPILSFSRGRGTPRGRGNRGGRGRGGMSSFTHSDSRMDVEMSSQPSFQTSSPPSASVFSPRRFKNTFVPRTLSTDSLSRKSSVFQPTVPISPIVKSIIPTKATETIVKLNSGKEVSAEDRAARFADDNQSKYLQLKEQRASVRKMYIRQGKMADPESINVLSQAVTFVGECMDMCPEYERYEREVQKGLDEKFEKIPGTDKVDHNRAVKRYRRSAAGDEEEMPCDVRPPPILIKTMDYLIESILGNNTLEDSYFFVRDRFRAIRKDFTLQNYRGMEAVLCHEQIARYHIMCSHDLCETEGVVIQQEHEQMRKTLQSLREYYQDLADEGTFSPHEAEFQAYYILSHLFQNEFISKAEQLRPEVYQDPRVQLAIELQHLVQRNNDYSRGQPRTEGSPNFYARFFRCMQDPRIDFLSACVIHMSLVSIRRAALKAMQKAYYNFPDNPDSWYPVHDVMDTLGLDSEDQAIDLLGYHGIPVDRQPSGEAVAHIGKIRQLQNGRMKMEAGVFIEDQKVSYPAKKSFRLVQVKKQGLTNVDVVRGHIQTPTLGRAPLPGKKPFIAVTTPTDSMLSAPRSAFGIKKDQKQAVFGEAPKSAGILTTPSAIGAAVHGFSFKQQAESAVLARDTFSQDQPQAIIPAPATSVSFGSTTNGFSFKTAEQKPQQVTRPSLVIPTETAPPVLKGPFSVEPPSFTSGPDLAQIKAEEKALELKNQLLQKQIEENRRLLIEKQRLEEELNRREMERRRQVEERARREQELRIKKEYEEGKRRELEERLRRKSIILDSLSVEMVEDLVSELVESTTRKFVTDHLDVNTLRSAYEDVVENIVENEVVPHLVKKYVYQEAANLCCDARNERTKYDLLKKWRARVASIQEERVERLKELQDKAVRFYLNALGIQSLPPSIAQTQQLLSKDAYFGKSFTPVVQFSNYAFKKVDPHSVDTLESVNIGDEVGVPLLLSDAIESDSLRNMHSDIHWKIVLKLPSDAQVSRNAQNMHRFCQSWLLKKLSGKSTGHPKTEDGFETILNTIHSVGDRQRLVRIMIQRDVSLSVTPSACVENARARCSGISGAIFQLELPPDSGHLSDYWNSEKIRLYTFISSFPTHSKVPLLLIAWKLSKTFSMQEIFNRLDLSSLISDGPVLSAEILEIPIVHIPDIGPVYEEKGATENLMAQLKLLASRCPQRPTLRTTIFKDLIEKHTLRHMESFLAKVKTLIEAPNLDVKSTVLHRRIFNAFVDIYNDQLVAIDGVLTNPALKTLVYPAKEFSIPDFTDDDDFMITPSVYGVPNITWNTDATFSYISSRLGRFKLGYMPDGESLDPFRLYIRYPSTLVNIPHVSSDSLQMLSSDIWHLLSLYREQDTSLSFPFSNIFSSIINVTLSALEYELSSNPSGPYFYSPDTVVGAIEWFKDLSSQRMSSLQKMLVECLKSPPKKRMFSETNHVDISPSQRSFSKESDEKTERKKAKKSQNMQDVLLELGHLVSEVRELSSAASTKFRSI